MGDYEREQERLEKLMNDLFREEEEEEDEIFEDQQSDIDDDIIETREEDSDTEQEIIDESDDENASSDSLVDSNDSEIFYIGHDKITKWRKTTPTKNIRTRAENKVLRLPACKLPTRSLRKTWKIWTHFINNEMIDLIVENTNIYISLVSDKYSRESDARPTNKAEIQALIGLLYYAGVLKANRLNTEDLWRADGSGVEIFRLTYVLK